MNRFLATALVALLAGCASPDDPASDPVAPAEEPRHAGFAVNDIGPRAAVAIYRTGPGASCNLDTTWSVAGAQEGIVGLHLLELGEGSMDKYWEILTSGSTMQVHGGAVDTRGPGPGLASHANVTIQASPAGYVNSTLVALELTGTQGTPLAQRLSCDSPADLVEFRTGVEVHLLDVDSASGAGASSEGTGIVAGSEQSRTFSGERVTVIYGWTTGNEGSIRIQSPEETREAAITLQGFNAATRIEGGRGEWRFGLDAAVTGFLWLAAFTTERADP